jgi:hypothetical protein
VSAVRKTLRKLEERIEQLEELVLEAARLQRVNRQREERGLPGIEQPLFEAEASRIEERRKKERTT